MRAAVRRPNGTKRKRRSHGRIDQCSSVRESAAEYGNRFDQMSLLNHAHFDGRERAVQRGDARLIRDTEHVDRERAGTGESRCEVNDNLVRTDVVHSNCRRVQHLRRGRVPERARHFGRGSPSLQEGRLADENIRALRERQSVDDDGCRGSSANCQRCRRSSERPGSITCRSLRTGNALKPLRTLRSRQANRTLWTGIALKTLRSGWPRIALKTLCTCGPRITLKTLWALRARRPGITLQPLRPLSARGTYGTRDTCRTWCAIRSGWANWACRALRTFRTFCSLRTAAGNVRVQDNSSRRSGEREKVRVR